MVFKDGGAFDFHSNFERVKERLQQAIEIARESGQISGDGSETGAGRGAGPLSGIDMSAIHLEQLPAYEEAGRPAAPLPVPDSRSAPLRDSGVVLSSDDERSAKASPSDNALRERAQPPMEPPPGYEEVQQSSVASELERRLRQEQ